MSKRSGSIVRPCEKMKPFCIKASETLWLKQGFRIVFNRPYRGFRRHFDEKANRLEITVFVWKRMRMWEKIQTNVW